jgi:GntR family transcriptional regulator
MAIERSSPAAQVANEMRRRIDTGRWPPRQPLPSDNALAEEFGVSRPTIAKARHVLVGLNLVESRAGAASYVVDPSGQRAAGDARVRRARATGRIYPDGIRARITSAATEAATADVAQALGLSPGDLVIARIRVIVTDDDTPISTSTGYFPAPIGEAAPRLLSTERIREGTALYVEQQTGRAVHCIGTTVTAVQGAEAARAAAERLSLSAEHAMLEIRTTSYDDDGAPLSHDVEYHPANHPIHFGLASV